MQLLRRRAADERGFVMVIALIVVTVILLVAATIVTTSATTSSHARTEYSRSGALAAANAGLEAAVHRLSNQAEETSTQQEQCFTTKFTAKETSGACPGTGWESLGNGAQYDYYVSPGLKTNECTGLWVEPPSGKTVTQRCVTAIGKAEGGAEARAQERVANVSGASIFVVNGIYSLSELFVNNKLIMGGEIVTRGNLTFNNNVESTGSGITGKYGGAISGESKCTTKCSFSKMTSEELGSEKYALPAQNAELYKEAEKSNKDSEMSITGGTGVNGNHELSENNSVTIKLASGVYYFCYIFLNNSATIEYTPPVTIYLDSHYRSGTGCPSSSTSGTVNMNNAVNWIDLGSAKNPSDMRILAWGKPNETSTSAPEIDLNNNVSGPWYAEIYAPYSYVYVNNSLQMDGGIEAGDIRLNNQVEFTFTAGSNEAGASSRLFYPTAYHVCSPSSTYSATGCY